MYSLDHAYQKDEIFGMYQKGCDFGRFEKHHYIVMHATLRCTCIKIICPSIVRKAVLLKTHLNQDHIHTVCKLVHKAKEDKFCRINHHLFTQQSKA